MYNPPMIFNVPNEVMKIGFEGGTLSSGKKYEGFIDAIARYFFHKNMGKWDYPMEYYQKKSLNIKI